MSFDSLSRPAIRTKSTAGSQHSRIEDIGAQLALLDWQRNELDELSISLSGSVSGVFLGPPCLRSASLDKPNDEIKSARRIG
jgi:hypothetical protein